MVELSGIIIRKSLRNIWLSCLFGLICYLREKGDFRELSNGYVVTGWFEWLNVMSRRSSLNL